MGGPRRAAGAESEVSIQGFIIPQYPRPLGTNRDTRESTMAKRPKPGKCVHCLNDPGERNWDHVFPRSWYPNDTPKGLAKWQIPSCIPCNARYGKIESDFLSRVALALEPQHSGSLGVIETGLRSMKPAAGRNERDSAMRLTVDSLGCRGVGRFNEAERGATLFVEPIGHVFCAVSILYVDVPAVSLGDIVRPQAAQVMAVHKSARNLPRSPRRSGHIARQSQSSPEWF